MPPPLIRAFRPPRGLPPGRHVLHIITANCHQVPAAGHPAISHQMRTLPAQSPNRLAAVPLIHIDESVDVSLMWRIEVPRARVWQCLTDADLLSQWLGELVSGAVGAGSDFEVDHGDGYCCRSTVVACAEPNRLDFTWHFPDEPASKVAIELDESGGTTGLRLTHSALGDLAESYRDGWCVHLSYLEAAGLGTPLPPSMFWRLHGTMAQLNRR
jgi:uncharacterized protein YndB with AHSA1/START domain